MQNSGNTSFRRGYSHRIIQNGPNWLDYPGEWPKMADCQNIVRGPKGAKETFKPVGMM